VVNLFTFIKCLTDCACPDWSVCVHYSSIKHVAYVTRVLYRVIMHAAYVMSLNARGFLLAAPRASLCTSLVFLKLPACLYNSIMHSDAFFYFFISYWSNCLHGQIVHLCYVACTILYSSFLYKTARCNSCYAMCCLFPF